MLRSWTCQIFVIFLPFFVIGAIQTSSTSLNEDTSQNEDDYNYDDYSYDGYDYEQNPCDSIDKCDFYDSDDCANQCHHRHFPSKTIQEALNTNMVSTCCSSSHAYIFIDDCKDRPNLNGIEVCGSPNHAPKLMSENITCPDHCTLKLSHHFKKSNVEINSETGEFIMMDPSEALKNATVSNYCAAYRCDENRGWELGFKACVCPDENHLKALDSNWPSKMPRCCPKSLLTLKSGQNVTCPLLETEAGKVCPFSNYKEHNFDVSTEGDVLVEKYDVAQGKRAMSKLEENKLDHYCIGSNWQIGGEKENPMKMKLFTCEEPCGGRKPCIRTCDDAPTLANWNSTLREFFRSESEIESHLTKANSLERKCPEFKNRRNLNRTGKCRDNFEIQKQNNGEIVLHWFHPNVTFNDNEYCLALKDGQMFAEICKDEHETKHRFKFYPYIFLTSCVFLLVTLLIYSIVPNLLNHYTRVMRHFVATIMVAFIIMAVNQLQFKKHLKDTNPELCKFFGFAIQYFSLTAFTLMCVMSCEIWLQLRGNAANEKRYRTEMLVGYIAPLMVTIMTGFTEACTQMLFYHTQIWRRNLLFFKYDFQSCLVLFAHRSITIY